MSVGERTFEARCLAAYRLRKVRHALKDMIITAYVRGRARAYIAALKALRDVVDWLGSRLAPECYWPDPDWHWLHS